MAEPQNPDRLPEASVVRPKRSRISVIWIIPILAAVVAIGIAVQRYLSEGPLVTIIFNNAEGIEAGKTVIKYKDVNIGTVIAVQLTDDFRRVLVRARIAKHASRLMVDDAKFWVVRPQITLSGISGLSTLLSGNYIGFQAGKSEDSANEFYALDVAPVIPGVDGTQFVLNALELGSLAVGSPIYYRQLPVGQVIGYDLAGDGQSVQIRIFINAPYDKNVFAQSRFWNASGISVTLNADGVDVHTESLVALLVGGIAFDLPPFASKGTPVAANSGFTLYSDRTVALRAPDPIAKHFVLKFNESVRGLSVGAPVTFLGLQAGEVTDVGLTLDDKTGKVNPRVDVTFYPERLIGLLGPKAIIERKMAGLNDESQRRAMMRHIFEDLGLRGQLKSGSLITGQLYVAFDYHPSAPKVKLNLDPEVPQLPVVESDLADLEAKVSGIVNKIDRLPLEAIGTNLNKDLASLDQTLATAHRLISNADEQLVPGLKSSIADLQRTLASAERALNNADTSYLQSSAPTQQEIRDALQEFTRAARSLRILLDELERQPSSVIRGKPKGTN
jgi:paraquat-inducible protein B